jgi:hypothetical protein
MRRRTIYAASLAAALILSGAACKRNDKVRVQATEEEPPQLSTTVHVADPRAAAQLVSGFYDIEQNAWRWTAGKFSVLLRTPRQAAQKGAILKLKFSVPEAVISKLNAVALSATVDGAGVPPETYTQSGEFVYTREIAPAALARDAAKVDFALDKCLAAGAVDARELGVIVTSVALEAK